jgi:hypothetical protein
MFTYLSPRNGPICHNILCMCVSEFPIGVWIHKVLVCWKQNLSNDDVTVYFTNCRWASQLKWQMQYREALLIPVRQIKFKLHNIMKKNNNVVRYVWSENYLHQRNTKVHHCLQKRPITDHFKSEINPVHTITIYDIQTIQSVSKFTSTSLCFPSDLF